jgi:DNA-binding transcriptional ArsR family regulator
MLDELIHQPTRLRIMAAVVGLEEEVRVDFGHLLRELELTDGNLSVHLQKLEDAGLVRIDKEFVGRRPRTWVQATRAGRNRFALYVSELESIVRAGVKTSKE